MSFREKPLPRLPAYLTISSLVAGCLGLLAALYVPNVYDQTIPPFVVFGALLGAFVYGANVQFDAGDVDRDWVSIVYFVLAGLAVVAYAGGFQRTLVVNVSLVGLYLISILGVFAFESPVGKVFLPILTATLHRAFIYYASATQMGLDALFHNRAAEAISATGTLGSLSLSKYWYTSGYHLWTATSTSVLDLPVRDAAFVSVTLVTILVAAVGVFAIVRRRWGETIGALAVVLLLVADWVVYSSVHTTPTTLGATFFILFFLFVPAYIATGSTRSLGAFVLVLAGITFTHQLSLFVVVVAVGSFALVYAVWARGDGWSRSRMYRVEGLLVGALLLQSVLTKYGGPAGENSRSFLETVAPDIVGAIARQFIQPGGPVADYPPAVVLSGADALSIDQVLGEAILFCFGLAGAIYWLSRQNGEDERTTIAFGAAVAIMSVVVFGGGLLGVSVFLPRRWLVFLIVPLVVLAAPGVVALSSKISPPRGGTLTVCLLLLAITTPYVVFMFANGVGAPDDPVLDDAPGAVRISTTTTEAATYGFVDDHAGESLVVADHLAWQMIDRHYEQPAERYTVEYGEEETIFEGQQLIVYRQYATTNHASYIVHYHDQPYRVYGPLPEPRTSDGIVYSAGDERVVYRPA